MFGDTNGACSVYSCIGYVLFWKHVCEQKWYVKIMKRIECCMF